MYWVKIKMSQMIHIRLEPAVYLALKSKNVNMSQIGNDLFKQYLDFDALPDEDESRIIDNLDRQKRIIKDAEREIVKLSVMLTKKKEDAAKQEKQFWQRIDSQAEALRTNDPLRDIIK